MSTSAGVAHADALMPVGFWVNGDGSEQFLIDPNGCSLADAQGVPTTSGPCTWSAGSAGGILTITSSQNMLPAPVYFSVVYVDQSTIQVNGSDVFYRRQ